MDSGTNAIIVPLHPDMRGETAERRKRGNVKTTDLKNDPAFTTAKLGLSCVVDVYGPAYKLYLNALATGVHDSLIVRMCLTSLGKIKGLGV